MSKQLWVSAMDLISARGDKENFIKTVAKTGATGLRMFFLYNWKGNGVSPWKQVGTWQAGYDDAIKMPFYDMNLANMDYWREVEWILSLLKKYDLSLYAVLDDFCSLKSGGWQKYLHPVLSSAPDRAMNNPNFNRFPGGYWAIGDDTIQPRIHLYICKLLDVIRKYEVDLRVERMNEVDALGWPDGYFITWHQAETDFLIEHGVPKERQIASPGRCMEAISKQVGIVAMHGYVNPDKLLNWQSSSMTILVSGDGGVDGNGLPDKEGRRGIGIQQARLMAERIKEKDFLVGYEYLSRSLYFENNDQANYDDYDHLPQKAMAEVFGIEGWEEPLPPEPEYISVVICSKSGKKALSDEFGNFICPSVRVDLFIKGTEPSEFCDIHKPTPPEPPKPCGYYFKRLNFRAWLSCLLDKWRKR